MYAGRPRGQVVGLPRSIHHIVNSSMRHTVSDGQDIDGPIVQSLHEVGWKDKLVSYTNHSRFDHISLQQPNCPQGLLFSIFGTVLANLLLTTPASYLIRLSQICIHTHIKLPDNFHAARTGRSSSWPVPSASPQQILGITRENGAYGRATFQ